MKKTMLVSGLLLCFNLSGCSERPANVRSATPQPNPSISTPASLPAASPSVPKNGDYPGKGKVTKINMDLGSVELDHEDIKDLMPPMIMEFYVKDKKMLDKLAVGDRADFVVRYKDGQEFIVDITKAK